MSQSLLSQLQIAVEAAEAGALGQGAEPVGQPPNATGSEQGEGQASAPALHPPNAAGSGHGEDEALGETVAFDGAKGQGGQGALQLLPVPSEMVAQLHTLKAAFAA